MNTIFKKLMALVLLAASPAAMADFTPAIFSYGNADILRIIFLGTTQIMGDPAFRNMIGFGFLVLLIFAAVGSLKQGRFSPDKMFIWLFGATFMFTVVLNVGPGKPTMMNVLIEDYIKPPGGISPLGVPLIGMGNSQVVEVPIFVGFPAVVTTEIGRVMRGSVEASYTGYLPEELRMSETGRFNLGSQILADMRSIEFTDPAFKATFNTFVKDCIIPEVYEGRKNIVDILNSTTVMEDMKPENVTRLTYFYGSSQRTGEGTPGGTIVVTKANGSQAVDAELNSAQGVMVSCVESWRAQKQRFESYAPELLGKLGTAMLNETSVLDQAVGSHSMWLFQDRGGDSNGSKVYMRAAIGNMLKGSGSSVTSESGSQNLVTQLSLAEAQATQKSTWMVSAEVFSNMFSYLFTVIQTFFYAASPLMLVLFVIPKIGGKAMFSFFGMMIWLSLWEPFLAIVHFISMAWLQTEIAGGASALTPANVPYITSAASKIRAATDFLATMVPLLTYGLVKGGEFAFTNFVKDAASPAAASKAAANIATDSVSYGAKSFNNFSANKHDATYSVASGTAPIVNNRAIGANLDRFDRGGTSARENESPIVKKGSSGGSLSTSLADQASQVNQALRSMGVDSAVADSISRDIGAGKGFNSSLMEQIGHQKAQAFGAGLASAQRVSNEAKASQDQSAGREEKILGEGSIAMKGLLAIASAGIIATKRALGSDSESERQQALTDNGWLSNIRDMTKEKYGNLSSFVSDMSNGSFNPKSEKEAENILLGMRDGVKGLMDANGGRIEGISNETLAAGATIAATQRIQDSAEGEKAGIYEKWWGNKDDANRFTVGGVALGTIAAGAVAATPIGKMMAGVLGASKGGGGGGGLDIGVGLKAIGSTESGESVTASSGTSSSTDAGSSISYNDMKTASEMINAGLGHTREFYDRTTATDRMTYTVTANDSTSASKIQAVISSITKNSTESGSNEAVVPFQNFRDINQTRDRAIAAYDDAMEAKGEAESGHAANDKEVNAKVKPVDTSDIDKTKAALDKDMPKVGPNGKAEVAAFYEGSGERVQRDNAEVTAGLVPSQISMVSEYARGSEAANVINGSIASRQGLVGDLNQSLIDAGPGILGENVASITGQQVAAASLWAVNAGMGGQFGGSVVPVDDQQWKYTPNAGAEGSGIDSYRTNGVIPGVNDRGEIGLVPTLQVRLNNGAEVSSSYILDGEGPQSDQIVPMIGSMNNFNQGQLIGAIDEGSIYRPSNYPSDEEGKKNYSVEDYYEGLKQDYESGLLAIDPGIRAR